PGERRAARRGRPGRDRAALPARVPWYGDNRRGAGRTAQRGVGSGGEPAARAEGSADVPARPVQGEVVRIPTTKAARHARIAALLSQQPIRSQPELAKLLAESGLEVTQATLSRDLDELGALKLRAEDGSLVYALPGEGGARIPP